MKTLQLLGRNCKQWTIAVAVTLLALEQFCLAQAPIGPRAAAQAQNGGTPKGAATRLGVLDTNLIRSDYYLGLELFADGRCLEAFQAFEKAYLNSRVIGETRGIDSVPPLIMMGECLYQQGDSGTAMQHFDAALNLTIVGQNWVNLLGIPALPSRPDNRPPMEPLWGPSNSKPILYWKSTRNWPIAIAPAEPNGLTELLASSSRAGLPSGSAIPKSPATIDALEILRCQSIALRRRFKILGPLIKVNPLSEAVNKAFSTSLPTNFPEEIRLAHETCYWLSLAGLQANENSIEGLARILIASDGCEHPLTASARLGISELMLNVSKYPLPDRETLLATLTAARAEQFDHLEEALELWSQCAFHRIKDQAIISKTLNEIQAFGQSRSRLVSIRSQLEQLRHATLNGDRDAVRARISQVTGVLQPQEVELPRMESVLHYANARNAFLDGNIEAGIQQLDESLAILRGATPLSTSSPPLYQLNLTLRLLSSEAISAEAGQEVLYKLLHSYRPDSWRTSVLEELVFQTHDKTEARRALVLLTLETQQYLEQLEVWEGWKRERINKPNVFQGRLAEFRRSIYAPANHLPESAPPLKSLQTSRAELLDALPGSKQLAQTLHQAILKTTTAPKWEAKRWIEEDRKQWEGILKTSFQQEIGLWNAATSPLPARDTSTPYLSPQDLFAGLEPNDAIATFYSLDGELYGYLLHANGVERWKIEDSATLETDLREGLRTALQISSDAPLPASPPSPAARDLASLRRKLIPDSILNQLLEAERWIVCPDGFLWDMPVELLPRSTGPGPTPSPGTNAQADGWYIPEDPIIQSHRVCYSPTLGHIPQLFSQPGKPTKSRVFHSNGTFWSDTTTGQKSYASKLAQFASSGSVVDTSGGASLPPPLFTKIACQHLIGLSEQHWSDPFRFPVLDGSEASSTISDWNPLPWGAPRQIWLLGHQRDRISVDNIIEPGDEWLRWTSALLSLGTENILVSRWSVGGESTLQLLSNALDYSEHSSLSEAWQRSVLTNWSEEFPTSGEPVARKIQIPRSDTSQAIPGIHPVLWSGYMLLGDPRAPE